MERGRVPGGPERRRPGFTIQGLRDELMQAIANLDSGTARRFRPPFCRIPCRVMTPSVRPRPVPARQPRSPVTIFNDLLCNPIEGERFVGGTARAGYRAHRELVMQIAQDAEDLARYSDLQVATLIGGMDYQKQLNRLHNTGHRPGGGQYTGPPADFMSRRDLYLDHIEILVLTRRTVCWTWALSPGKAHRARHTPRARTGQTLLFSATFTQDIINLEQWTYEPITIEIEPDHVSARTRWTRRSTSSAANSAWCSTTWCAARMPPA